MEYANAKPNFCAKCGSPMHSLASSMTVSPKPSVSELSEEETDVESVPNIDRLQIDYDVAHDNRSFTLGSLVGENTPPERKSRNAPRRLDEFIDDKKG